MGSVGRHSLYKSEYCEQAKKLCLLGATDKNLAYFFNICEATLNVWKIKYPEFMESLKSGKEIADSNVASSLYLRAIGYKHKEDDIRVCGKEIVVTPTIKHYPPDTVACIFWLKNRRPDLWRDKVDHSFDDVESVQLTLNKKAEEIKAPEVTDEILPEEQEINADNNNGINNDS